MSNKNRNDDDDDDDDDDDAEFPRSLVKFPSFLFRKFARFPIGNLRDFPHQH